MGGWREVWFPDSESGRGAQDGSKGETVGTSREGVPGPVPTTGPCLVLSHTRARKRSNLTWGLPACREPRLAGTPASGLEQDEAITWPRNLTQPKKLRIFLTVVEWNRSPEQGACRAIHGSPVQHQQSMIGPGVGRKQMRSRAKQVRGSERTSSSNGI